MQPFPFRQLCSKSPAQLYRSRAHYDGWQGNCLEPGPWISDGRLAVLPCYPYGPVVENLTTRREGYLLPQSVVGRMAQRYLSPLPPLTSPEVELRPEEVEGKVITPPLILLTDRAAMNGYYHDLVITLADPTRFHFCPSLNPFDPGIGFYFRRGVLVAALRGYSIRTLC